MGFPFRSPGLAAVVLLMLAGGACDSEFGTSVTGPSKDCQGPWGGTLTATINGIPWGPVRAYTRDVFGRGALSVGARDCVYGFSLSGGRTVDGPGIYAIGGTGGDAYLESAEAWRATTSEGRGRGVVEFTVFTETRVSGTFALTFDHVVTSSGTGVVMEGRFEECLDCSPAR